MAMSVAFLKLDHWRTLMKKYLAAAALIPLILLSGLAHSSTYTGKVVTIRSQPSPSVSGHVRVSVQVNGTTSCPFGGWYSYDVADGPVGDMWRDQLITAQSRGRTVSIAGTGTCDPFGVESVNFIDSK
jgi:hypothetical protein